MDIAEAMELFRASNKDAAGIVQTKLSELGGEAGNNRRDNTDLKKQMADMQSTFSELAKKIGASDVRDVPKIVETQNTEFKAILEQQKQSKIDIDALKAINEKNESLLGRTTIITDLTKKFKAAGFKDPEDQAELFAFQSKKGETGLLIGDKFADDVIKNRGIDKPYLLSKEIPKTTKTDSNGVLIQEPKTNFTNADIKMMTPEQLAENKPAILAQAQSESESESGKE